MRRTVLLLATTALTLIAAGGIALAATLITCSTDPCDGTTDDDVITGTVGAETINGNVGNDEISARDGNDIINGDEGNDTLHGELGDDRLNGGDGPDKLFGENGTDRLNGGVGDDILNGSPASPETENINSYYDYYLLTPNWGNDTIIDSRGRGVINVADAASAATMPNLTVNLVSDASRPEVSDGKGNTMNWENNDIMVAVTGAGDDVISMRPGKSNLVNGGAGSDTYTGYTTDPSGDDSIQDLSGTADVLDLSSRSLASARWTTPYTTNARTLRIDFHGGPFFCTEEGCDYIDIAHYFDNTSPDACASGPGAGLIETIKFADDPRVDFAQVKSLAVSQDGIDNNHDGNTDEPDETCPAPTEGDTTAPTVTDVMPTDAEQDVATGTIVESGFSEAMNPDTINASTFTLTKQDSSTPVEATVGYETYNPTYGVASLSPNSKLAPNTTYTATIKGGASGAKDLAGNALGQNRSWTFTTAPPSVVSYTPTETTSVPRNIRPTATFSTNMNPSTITATNIKFELYDTTKRAWVSVAHTVSYDATSKTATVNPGSTLAASKQYRVTVTTNVKSSTGVALDQDVNTSGNQLKSWTFTTGTLSVYSAVGNFSASQNPSGAWSYGYRASSESFVLYASHTRPWGPSFDQWSLYDSPYVTPHVTYNRSGQTAVYSTITHPPDVLNLHPCNSGQKSVVRWTAPSSATIKIEGRFEGIDTHGTTTDVAVVKNMETQPLFSRTIDGYYGEDKLPQSAVAPFAFTTSVRAGDIIEFVVGYGSGPNANHGFDSTGLSATITY